jgi:membrane protease YdiL (CAAX protease family)
MTHTSTGTFSRFIKRHAVLAFYVLVLALGVGPTLVFVGPGAFLGTTNLLGTDTELTSAAGLDPLMYLALMAGPPTFALVAILVIGVAFGRAGLRALRSRLFRWRVGVRWYAVALLTAPVLWTVIQGALRLTSKDFLPDIITTDDKVSLLVAGLVVGLVASFFEEIAWTGFATHEVSKRHDLLATGLIVGLPWCALHVSLFAGVPSGAVPQALNVAVILFAFLLPYRVLMVWVYDRTQSVLMAMLMHLALILSTFALSSAAMVGVPELIFDLAVGATLWVLVAVVVVVATDRRTRTVTRRLPPGRRASYSPEAIGNQPRSRSRRDE